jgi:hypothetical protein
MSASSPLGSLMSAGSGNTTMDEMLTPTGSHNSRRASDMCANDVVTTTEFRKSRNSLPPLVDLRASKQALRRARNGDKDAQLVYPVDESRTQQEEVT